MHTAHHTDPKCRVCGTAFRPSRMGVTVNCPAHRGRAVKAAKAKTWPAIECGRCGKVHTTLKCDGCGF